MGTESDYTQRIKNVINGIKIRYGIKTQEAVCERLGCNKSYFSGVVNRNEPLSRQLVTRFSKEFFVNPDYLERGVGDMFLVDAQQSCSNNIIGNSNRINADNTILKLVDELSEFRKMMTNSQSQIDRLLNIIESMQTSKK